MNVDDVLVGLEGCKRSGQGYVARCPAHDDGRASLSVTEGVDGRVLLHCHAGCTVDAICAALLMVPSDLFPENGDGPASSSPRRPDILATYDYTDEQGKLLYQVVRFQPKDFRQRRPDGSGGWIWKLGDVPRVLYHLLSVKDQAKAGGEVWICEGEKDAEALRAAGVVATCNAGGAGKWRDEYSACLAGAKVTIVADADEPGRKHAAAVAAAVGPVAASVRIVEAAEGKDASDHLAAGRGLAEFVELTSEGERVPRVVTAPELATMTAERPDYVVFGYVARGSITELSAQIKAGKTRLAMELCRAVVEGGEFLGHATVKTNVLYLTEERPPTFRAGLARSGLIAHSELHILLHSETRGMEWSQVGEFVISYCARHDIGMVVVDTLSRWAGLATDLEKDAGAAGEAMRPLEESAAAGAAVVAIRHERKGGGEIGESARGSSAFGGSMDVLVSLKRMRGRGHPRRRTLDAVGRFDETPDELVIELTEDGRYVSLGTREEASSQSARRLVIDHLPDSRSGARTGDDIHEAVQTEEEIGRSIVRKALKDLVDEGIASSEKGAGSAGSRALGYWLSSGENADEDDDVGRLL